MTGRGLLLGELERIVANCCRLLSLVRAEHHGYQPRPLMRTLMELANHLAQVPSVDYRIMRGDAETQVAGFEEELRREAAEDWQSVMREGASELAHYIEHLTHDNYENGSCTAYYGRTQTNAQWLLEVITHIYHHRAQLFTYLKILGYDVNTRTLYE